MNSWIYILLLSNLLYSYSYISPGVSVGVNSTDGLFISTQVSIGITFLEDHINDNPTKALEYIIPSATFGIKYSPNKEVGNWFSYLDAQVTIAPHYFPPVVGFGVGRVMGIDSNYSTSKIKYYVGYILLYNSEIEKIDGSKNRSLMVVLPIPFDELN